MAIVHGMLALAHLLGFQAQAQATPAPAGSAPSPPAAEAPATPGPNSPLFEDYLDAWYEAHPVQATALGIHRHDGRLPDLSRRGVRRRVRALRDWLGRLEAEGEGACGGEPSRFDRRVLDHAIRAELLELEEIRAWQRDPMLYRQVLAGAVASLVDREFAPLGTRMDALIARLGGFEALIAAARRNLRDVPRPWAEQAAGEVRAAAGFLRHDAARALAGQGLAGLDVGRRAAWRDARDRAVGSLLGFAAWLEDDLLPRAGGDFRLGPELFRRKLQYEEFIDLPLERLARMNQRAIADYRDWVARVAARIAPDEDPAAVMRRIAADHPPEDELLETARGYVEQARRFVVGRDLLSLPSDAVPEVRATPGFARAGFASMSAPGPFETGPVEAYYQISLVDPRWSPAQRRQHLTYFNRPGLLGISIHEAIPGHFVQLLYRRRLPTDVRKVFAPSTLVEGWAHYAEQMMVDEGLGGGDPAVRLGQLRRALQRHARWYAALALHVEGRPVDEVVQRFGEIAYFAHFPARREVLRATWDPTYLSYALGRMMLLELREDWMGRQRDRGRPAALREFHDRFLRLGLPIPLAREALLGDGVTGAAGPAVEIACGSGRLTLRGRSE